MKKNYGINKFMVRHIYWWTWSNPMCLAGTPIVIDSGSRFVKVGEAGNEIPRYVLPSLVASSRTNKGEYLAGFEALRKANDPRKWNIQPVFDPMEPDWDSALSLWEHIFQVSHLQLLCHRSHSYRTCYKLTPLSILS